MAVPCAVAVAAMVVLLVQLRAVRADVERARSLLEQVTHDSEAFRTPAGRAGALAKVDTATSLLRRGQRRTTGSVLLSVAGHVPGLGNQRTALIALVSDARAGSIAARDVVAGVDDLAAQTKIDKGRVPYQNLARLGGVLRRSSATVAALDRPSRVPGPLGGARRRFDGMVRAGAARLDRAVEGLDAARGFLGESGDRRYFVAIQNNAEMRDQGMVLSYALAEFRQGTLSFGAHGSVEQLQLDRPAPTPLSEGTLAVFGALAPTQTWQSVNASADFAVSGQTMVDMYRQATGQSVDGVVAIDVPALAAILRAVGPVAVEGEDRPITADNVAATLLHELYDGIRVGGDRTRLRQREANITTAVISQLTTADYGVLALAEELGAAAGGGHIRLWSRVAAEEKAFEHSGIGGGPATSLPDRTIHLAVENRSATKVDYYVKPTVHLAVHLTTSGTAIVRTTVELDNQAPVGAAPSYQLGPDASIRTAGEYLAWVLQWGPAGSTQPGGVAESGLVVSQHVVTVTPGSRVRLTLPDMVIPDAVRDGRLDLRLVPQPRLDPMPIDVVLTTDGWGVAGSRTWSGAWDRVVHLSWRVHR